MTRLNDILAGLGIAVVAALLYVLLSAPIITG